MGDHFIQIWAINLDWLEAATNELLREVDPETSVPDDPSVRAAFFNELRGPGELGVIIRISPLQASQRMVAQQGLFLCKLFHQATFNQVLMRMMVGHDACDIAAG